MPLDGKLLARAKARLDARRLGNEEEHARRLSEAYLKNPKIAEIDAAMRSTVADAIGYALTRGHDPTEAVDELAETSLQLQEDRRMELLAAGFGEDWLDEKPVCPKCGDAGWTNGGICSCLMELYAEEQKKDLSALLKLSRDTFDNFDLSLYDAEPDPVTGVSPRDNMEIVYETCVQYARRFGKTSLNLLFCGGTGLGKTFLSTCIAKVVSEKGFSVVYDTAVSVFTKYEDMKFGRGDEYDLRSDIKRCETCDLLILDDVGTELPTAFVTSALYTLVNTRLTTGKKTVISTNLTLDELRARYSPAVMSRLEGEFSLLPFFGRDIRLMKK